MVYFNTAPDDQSHLRFRQVSLGNFVKIYLLLIISLGNPGKSIFLPSL